MKLHLICIKPETVLQDFLTMGIKLSLIKVKPSHVELCLPKELNLVRLKSALNVLGYCGLESCNGDYLVAY